MFSWDVALFFEAQGSQLSSQLLEHAERLEWAEQPGTKGASRERAMESQSLVA